MRRAGFGIALALCFTTATSAQQTPQTIIGEIRGLLDQLEHVVVPVSPPVQSPTPPTVTVPAGGDLAAALAAATPGTIVRVEAGATYTGNFTIKTGQTLAAAPPKGRVSPTVPGLARIVTPNGSPALATAPGAHDIAIVGLEITGNNVNDLVLLGDGSSAQNDLSLVPQNILVDRCYIHGDPTTGGKRGIALNSGNTTIRDSYIADFKRFGQDTQAIAGWNGPGPYLIQNNYLEAAAEDLIFGGADPSIPNLVPSDIRILGNTLSKQTAWRGQGWLVKNLFELKNAQRVTVIGNVFEYNWPMGQDGRAVLFTVRNQDGHCPWCVVQDVEFAGNEVRHVGAVFSILGFDNNQPSQQTRRINIHDNVIWDLDPVTWGNNGALLLAQGQPRDITIDHNTVVAASGWDLIQLDGPPISGFVLTNNLMRHLDYGIIGSNFGVGNSSIVQFLDAPVIAKNVFAGGPASLYPAGNFFPSLEDFLAQFTPMTYRLVAGSPYRNAGTDGRDLGVVWTN